MNITKAMLNNFNNQLCRRLLFVGIKKLEGYILHKKFHHVKSEKRCTSRLVSTQKRHLSSMKNLNSLSEKEKREFFDSIDTVLTDCDGVLWLGSTPIPGAVDVINKLKDNGKNIFFVTNNSTKTRADLLDKSLKLGYHVDIKEMITSCWLASVYLKSINFRKKAYIVGRKSISEELAEIGIESFGHGPDPLVSTSITQDQIIYPNVAAVIVGHDVHFSYPKMVKACNYLTDPSCLFIATNTDPSLPHAENKVAPGAGAFVKAIETCAGREPIIVGKPSKTAVQEVLKANGLNPKRALMIGDRCTTDIAFGNECSMHTLFVLTGIDNLQTVKKYEENNLKHLLPTYYADSIAELLKCIDAGK